MGGQPQPAASRDEAGHSSTGIIGGGDQPQPVFAAVLACRGGAMHEKLHAALHHFSRSAPCCV